MDRQLHVRLSGDLLDFKKVDKNFLEPIAGGDRLGGFWTSTFDGELGSDWIQKKIYKPYIHIYRGYLFEVINNPKIYKVKNPSDEEHFVSFYKSDYNEIAKDYNGLHLSKSFFDEFRIYKTGEYDNSNFLMWNVECTWWFDIEFLSLNRTLESDELKKFV